MAVLEGANVKFIEPQDAMISELPTALNSLLTFYSSAGREESDNILVRLAISMRAHQRGGTLLVVPHDSEEWRLSLVKPISYSVTPPFSEIDGLPHDSDGLRAAVDALAGWTAVDGATVISDQFALLASGVKIVSRDTSSRIERVLVTEPVEGSLANDRRTRATRKYQAYVRCPVRARSARCHRIGCVAGWPFHDIRLVSIRCYCACPSTRIAASLARLDGLRHVREFLQEPLICAHSSLLAEFLPAAHRFGR